MNESDMKTKKQWLITVAMLTISSLFSFYFQIPKNFAALSLPPWFSFYMTVSGTVLSLAYFYLLYRCIYKKPGTKLLTFVLIIMPVSWASSIAAYALGKVPAQPTGWSIVALFQQALGIWWYVLNWKMRRINKEVQKLSKIVSTGTSSS